MYRQSYYPSQGVSDYELPQSEDIFDSAGFYVPTAVSSCIPCMHHIESYMQLLRLSHMPIKS